MAGEKILVAGGESAIREIVSFNLGRKGYDVTAVEDLQTAQEMIHVDPPDLLILDVLPPGVDSYEFARQVGASSTISLILLTVIQEGLEGILGLNWSADDIVIKPFSIRELASRVRAVLRRKRLAHSSAGGAHLIDNLSNSSSAKRILVVVDEPHTARSIKKKLDLDGYQTLEARDGFQALEKVLRHELNLVILDVGMQGQDGLETLEHLRKFSDIPVMMLTGFSDSEVRIRGLELDADDFLSKPFSSRELSSRIRAVLRRTKQTVDPPDGDQPKSVSSRRFAIGTRRESVEEEKIAPCPQRILRQLLATYGTGLLNEPSRVDAFLADLCGGYRKERHLIVLAMRDRIPAELLAHTQGVAFLLPRLTRRLQERYGLSAEAAQWAIGSWGAALNVGKIHGLAGRVASEGSVSTDRETLVTFYHATNGSRWRNNMNWLSHAPLNSWYGVTTDRSGRVTRLTLSKNQLSGSIPPELGDLFSLKLLYLSSNKLSGPIPPELGNLSSLTSLALSNNQLSGSIPPDLGILSDLTLLYLSRNRLNGSIPSEFGNLSKLKSLDLSYNRLSGSIPPELGNLDNLTLLRLSRNQFRGPLPSKLRNLPKLKKIDLNEEDLSVERTSPNRASHANRSTPFERSLQNDIDILVAFYDATGGENWYNNKNWLSNEPLDFWHGVTTDSNGRVEFLYLPNNELRGSIPTGLGFLSNLTWLDLSNRHGSLGGTNKLKGPIPTTLGNLSNLARLNLSNNQLSGPIPHQLDSLDNLGMLDLSNNQLSGLIPSHLGILYKLTSLSLGNNRLSGSIPPQLGNLPELMLLDLENNQLSGSIPPQLGNLSNLTLMDLRSNQLRGPIPHQLANLANLKFLELSGNMLYGPIPPQLTSLMKEGYRPQDEDIPF